MATKKSWLVNLLKKLFLCQSESQPLPEKRPKRFRWIFGSFRELKQLPPSSPETTLNAAREEQMKHALNVARATAAAAEAAVAAAQAAATLVQLTGVSQQPSQSHSHGDNQFHIWAATQIQTAFRGYLARKALRALKALVRLQAIARGRAVRRSLASAKPKLLLSTSSSTSLSHSTASRALGSDVGNIKQGEKIPPTIKTRIDLGEAIRNDLSAEREWKTSIFTKDEAESLLMRKHDAVNRRRRMKQYSFSHREQHMQYAQVMDEPLLRRYNEKQSMSIRSHLAEERRSLYRNDKLDNFLPSLYSKPRPINNNFDGNSRYKQRSFWREADFTEEELHSPLSNPRRSFCHIGQKSNSGDDNNSVSTNSPMFPSYMAATESAKAKAKMRSMSTPRQRIRYLDQGYYFEHGESCRNMRSSWSAFNCETMGSFARTGGSHLKSLSTRSLQQP